MSSVIPCPSQMNNGKIKSLAHNMVSLTKHRLKSCPRNRRKRVLGYFLYIMVLLKLKRLCFATILLLLSSITACGQKGMLYLPPEAEENISEKSD